MRGDKFPRFNRGDTADPDRLMSRLNELVTTLENRLVELEQPLVDPRNPATGEEVYTVSNVTELRTLDPDASGFGLDDLADFVGTFITDLINEDKLR